MDAKTKGFGILILAALVAISLPLITLLPSIKPSSVMDESALQCKGCNVIFISIDTLRADHLGSYGYFNKDISPNIDALAGQGMLFSEAFSQVPFTPDSHLAMMNALYPLRSKMILASNASSESKRNSSAGFVTLADVLKGNGYRTAAFVGNELVNSVKQGFEEFNAPKGVKADGITAKGVEWLKKNKDGRFFLFLHYWDAHFPYAPPAGYDTYNYSREPYYADERYGQKGLSARRQRTLDCDIRCDIAKYDGEISYVDDQIGTLLREVDGLGLSNNTVIVITSDHGENFGEHNMSDFGYPNEGPCLFHTFTLYDEEVHVPLILKGPNIPADSRREGVVELIDITPTLLDMLDVGMGRNTTYSFDGRSLLPLMAGDGNQSGYAISQLPKQISTGDARKMTFGIRTDGWKLVRLSTPKQVDLDKSVLQQSNGAMDYSEDNGTAQPDAVRLLFNLKDDPSESVNVARQENAAASSLEMALLGRINDITSQAAPGTEVKIDKETEDLLRSLGYVS